MSALERIDLRLAIDHSRNFATAKPDIGSTEREHILGLCNLLERREAAITDLIEAARIVALNAHMTAAEDAYHEVSRAEMDALVAAYMQVKPLTQADAPSRSGDPVLLADQLTEEANALLALAGMLRGSV